MLSNEAVSSDGEVTKDFVKPTVQGREFINGKSHQTNAIFKSNAFGEARILRRLNKSKEDYLTGLSHLNRKASDFFGRNK